MKVRAWLYSSLDGEKSHVDFEIKDNASVNDIYRAVSNIAEQHYANKAEWEIVEE